MNNVSVTCFKDLRHCTNTVFRDHEFTFVSLLVPLPAPSHTRPHPPAPARTRQHPPAPAAAHLHPPHISGSPPCSSWDAAGNKGSVWGVGGGVGVVCVCRQGCVSAGVCVGVWGCWRVGGWWWCGKSVSVMVSSKNTSIHFFHSFI